MSVTTAALGSERQAPARPRFGWLAIGLAAISIAFLYLPAGSLPRWAMDVPRAWRIPVQLFAELESAYQRQAPIILWIYAPHWAVAKYEGEWVEFPAYEKACYEDPAWGSNPDATHDCGKPRGPIWKVAWAGVKDKWPGAYEAIKAFNIGNDEMGQLITKVDLDGQTVEAVSAEWVAANEARWQEWIAK